MARELLGKVLSAWTQSARAKAVITHLHKATTDPASSDGPTIMKLLQEYWGTLFTQRPVSSSSMVALMACAQWKSLGEFLTVEEVSSAFRKNSKQSLTP